MISSSKNNALYLAIDQGGHASRAIVFDGLGHQIARAEVAITTATPKPGWVEHEAGEMLDSVRQAIATVIQQPGVRGKKIRAAGLATQRASMVCWDKLSGEPLSAVISWQDRRHQAWLAQLASKQKFIHQHTGLMLSPHYGGSKIRWCLDHLVEVQQALENGRLTIGPLASYLAFKLLRQTPLLADPANASRTQLWNIEQHDWDPALLALYQIPGDILPPASLSHQHFGDIEIAGQCIPLTVITGDQSAALFGWGEPQPDTAYINIGTGAFVQRTTTAPLHADALLSSVVYRDERGACYTLEGTVNGAARALQWLARREGIEHLEQQLSSWMEEIRQPPLFLNGVAGLAAPYWAADFDSRFIGAGGASARAVAVAESIVFLLQRIMEESERYLPPASRLRVSGGLAGLTPLCQRLADLSGKPVVRPKTLEATARGLAYLCAGQPGIWPVEAEETFTPRKATPLIQRYFDWRAKLEKGLSETGGVKAGYTRGSGPAAL
ncbi:MAG TPA: hypothetical protein ENK35_08825 [Candidatus Tenderia sp.]|nr:hypothetical protein [Candidatus Tenderia sp.]